MSNTLKPLKGDGAGLSILLAPTIVGLAVGVFGSILAAFLLSFFKWDLIGVPEFVGAANYADLPTDRVFKKALPNTLKFAAVYVPLVIVISFGLALLLNRPLRGVWFLRMLFFLPVVSSPAATGLIWNWVLSIDNGILNGMLGLAGIEPIKWLGRNMVLYSVVMVNVWGAIGGGMIIFLAGLQSVPRELYEAAHVDGATAWQRLRFITIPTMVPSIFFQAVLSTINAFQAFDYIYMLTRQANGNSSFPTMVFSLYRSGFRFFRLGDAAAQAVVLTVMILIMTLIYIRIQRSMGGDA